MKKKICINTMIGISFSLLISSTTNAGVISSGDLSVTIRDDNGAIDTVVYQGGDYFNPGSPVSDFGFQNGGDTGTFVLNNTSGGSGQPVSVVGNMVSGTFTGGGANLSFTRTYSLVTGLSVLRVTTSFINNGSSISLSYFDTFDPDQGTSYGNGDSSSTYNDVLSVGAYSVAQASLAAGGDLRTVLIGSDDTRSIVGTASDLGISNGSELNTFLSSPGDGGGVKADVGMSIGLAATLSGGETTSFTYYMAFGENTTVAQNNFVAAIPEPSSILLMGLVGGAGLFMRRRLRR